MARAKKVESFRAHVAMTTLYEVPLKATSWEEAAAEIKELRENTVVKGAVEYHDEIKVEWISKNPDADE
jgi:hypothetical protein